MKTKLLKKLRKIGRKKILTPSPLKKWYMEHLLLENQEGVILTPTELTHETTVKLRRLHPDLFVVAAYGKLVPQEIRVQDHQNSKQRPREELFLQVIWVPDSGN